MESLTDQLYNEAKAIIDEVEEMGGMAKAIDSGMPKYRIEESAAKRQAMIDSGKEVIVGVNKYKTKTEDEIEVLKIDNSAVMKKQVERLTKVRTSRDEPRARAALDKLTAAARDGNGNLLALSVEASLARCSVGEISDALEEVFGRHVPKDRVVTGAYAQVATEQTGDASKNEFEETIARVQ